MLAKIYAQRGDLENCLHSLQKAEESGYRDLENVYTLANHLRDHMDDELIYLPGIE